MSDSLRPHWTRVLQALVSSVIFQSLLRFTSIELVMLSNHLTPGLTFSFCVCTQSLSHAQLFATPRPIPHQVPLYPWNFPGKKTAVGCHLLLQEIFLTQGLNPCILCLLLWQKDSLSPSHLGNPPFAFNLSQHQSFVMNRSPHQVAKLLEL